MYIHTIVRARVNIRNGWWWGRGGGLEDYIFSPAPSLFRLDFGLGFVTWVWDLRLGLDKNELLYCYNQIKCLQILTARQSTVRNLDNKGCQILFLYVAIKLRSLFAAFILVLPRISFKPNCIPSRLGPVLQNIPVTSSESIFLPQTFIGHAGPKPCRSLLSLLANHPLKCTALFVKMLQDVHRTQPT